MKKVFILLILLAPFSDCLATDVVRMKNGDVFRGEILKQEMNHYVQIQLDDHNEKRLKWEEIHSIEKEQGDVFSTEKSPLKNSEQRVPANDESKPVLEQKGYIAALGGP